MNYKIHNSALLRILESILLYYYVILLIQVFVYTVCPIIIPPIPYNKYK